MIILFERFQKFDNIPLRKSFIKKKRKKKTCFILWYFYFPKVIMRNYLKPVHLDASKYFSILLKQKAKKVNTIKHILQIDSVYIIYKSSSFSKGKIIKRNNVKCLFCIYSARQGAGFFL